MNVALVISSITAITAIIAPVATNIINNRHQEKMKHIEMYETKRIEVINEYVSRAEKYIGDNENECLMEDFRQYKNQAYLYMPKSLWIEIDNLHNAIDEGDQESARAILSFISKVLSDYTCNMPNRE